MDLRENLIICLGSPMIDITARVPYDFLQRYKLRPNNATSYNEFYNKVFENIKEYGPTYTTGGSITHTVKSLQKSLKFPGVCSYIGAVGTDNFGKEIKKELKKEEINVFFEEIDEEATAKCAVLLYEDNRSFITDLGASKYLSDDFIEINGIKDIIARGKFYYISAFFFKVSSSIVHKICNHAKAENKTFILNIGAPFLCSEYIQEFREILPQTNILIGNVEESTQLAKVLGSTNDDINAVALYLYNYSSKSQRNESIVIVTGGDGPIMLANVEGVRKFEVPPLKIQRKLNTSGAGDYFAGGFIASFMQNKPIAECIHSGIMSSYALIEQNS